MTHVVHHVQPIPASSKAVLGSVRRKINPMVVELFNVLSSLQLDK